MRREGTGRGGDGLAGSRRAPERHDLVWLRPAAAGEVRVAEPARRPAVARWLALGRPAVVRRRAAGDLPAEVALGIPLPPGEGGARVALAAPASAVARWGPPLPLGEALAVAPRAWHAPLAALDAAAREAGLVLRVHGSLAWQRLTGEVYLRAGSDVDLLVDAATPAARARALALLAAWGDLAAPRLDGELRLGGGRSAAWRELLARPARVLVKGGAAAALEPLEAVLSERSGFDRLTPSGISDPHSHPARSRLGRLTPSGASFPRAAGPRRAARGIEAAALAALRAELATSPKPGLVCPGDPGAHADMDAATFAASLGALRGFFAAAAAAGGRRAPFAALRALGLEAEARMLRATGGVNTHRGAIFALGLLAAAAGRLAAEGRSCAGLALSGAVREAFADDLRRLEPAPGSHGAAAARAHGVGGAREEAARGFPHVFEIGLPALDGSLRRGASFRAASVQCLLALVARLPDTNLLHRGGAEGLAAARGAARRFLLAGGVHRPGWRAHADALHRAFVARRLSPGGSADLLAATLFAHALRRGPSGRGEAG